MLPFFCPCRALQDGHIFMFFFPLGERLGEASYVVDSRKDV